jgi:hypothetical protein
METCRRKRRGEGIGNSQPPILIGLFFIMFHKKYPPTRDKNITPIGRTEANGRWRALGRTIGSKRKAMPPRVRNPSHRVKLQKITIFVICSAESPQAE